MVTKNITSTLGPLHLLNGVYNVLIIVFNALILLTSARCVRIITNFFPRILFSPFASLIALQDLIQHTTYIVIIVSIPVYSVKINTNAHNVHRIRFYNLDHVNALKDSDYIMVSALVVIKVVKNVIITPVLNVLNRNFNWKTIVQTIVLMDFINLTKFVGFAASCAKPALIKAIFV